MSTGDSAVLGRLFSHLHARPQISKFLNAMQEIREQRVRRVIRAAAGNIFAVNLPPGLAASRDRELRARAKQGVKSLHTLHMITTGGAGSSKEMVEVRVLLAFGYVCLTVLLKAIEGIFGYDPEDEADNWWVEWGLTQERAARIFDDAPMLMNARPGAH